MALFETALYGSPIDVLEEGLDVVGTFQSIIDHEGMLEYIQHQYGNRTGQVACFMLVDPLVN